MAYTPEEKLIGQKKKSKSLEKPTGKLVFWHDVWTNEFGLGIVIGVDVDYNVKPFVCYNSDNEGVDSPSWLKILVCNIEGHCIKKLPRSWIYDTIKFNSLSDFEKKLDKVQWTK